ncbi:MAG TPA: hypothetical protein VN724_12875 [Pyrinomonadaceae bacterium]|nr:hypothetical protein [Pyrinomonadaceae bacterium]
MSGFGRSAKAAARAAKRSVYSGRRVNFFGRMSMAHTSELTRF